ncbi:MAG: hypothetical protein ACRDL5_12935 [Solirubrobacteraceae bacterium]
MRASGRLQRATLAGLAALIIAAVATTLAVGAGRGVTHATARLQRISTTGIRVINSLMAASLRRDRLTWHWIVCLRNGRRFHGVPIVRCNVDFGDPHIEAYCVVLRGGDLLTNFEDRTIPCGPDNAGNTQTIASYN